MRLISDDTFGIMTVWAEARGEPPDGRMAVAEVIQRRAKTRYFSNGSIWDTVLRPAQFSCWQSGDPNFRGMLICDDQSPDVAACAEAWYAAKTGPEIVPGAVLYVNLGALHAPPAWVANCDLVAKVGNHSFFKPKVM